MTQPSKGDLVVIKEMGYWDNNGFTLVDNHPERHLIVGQIFEVDRVAPYNRKGTIMIKTPISPSGEWCIPMEFVEVIYSI